MRHVAVDVETANADMASTCAVGAAVFEQGRRSSEWYSLINRLTGLKNKLARKIYYVSSYLVMWLRGNARWIATPLAPFVQQWAAKLTPRQACHSKCREPCLKQLG